MFGENVGYKVSAEYARADDWSNQNIYAPIAGTTPSPESGADFNTNVARGEGALVYYGGRPGGRLELIAGASKTNTLGLTNLGRNQIIGWNGGESGSVVMPPSYQKLGGPWTDGKDPAQT